MEISFKKSARVKKEEGAGFQSLKSKSNIGGGFHLLSCVCSPVWLFYVGTIEVCRVEVYSVLFDVCAFCPVCDMWCCLFPYNAI